MNTLEMPNSKHTEFQASDNGHWLECLKIDLEDPSMDLLPERSARSWKWTLHDHVRSSKKIELEIVTLDVLFYIYALHVRGLIGWKLAREMTPLLNWAISSFDDSTASKLVMIYICVFSSFLFLIQSFMLMRVCWRQTFMAESTILWRKFSQPNHHQSQPKQS